MKAQDIYDLLRAGGLSRAGALGMLGNMQAESGLKEDIEYCRGRMEQHC